MQHYVKTIKRMTEERSGSWYDKKKTGGCALVMGPAGAKVSERYQCYIGKEAKINRPAREGRAMTAYILIEVTPGTSRDVAAKAQKIDGVKSVSVVTGPHDVIAVVETSNAKALGDLLITKLQQIEGVASTITDVVID